MREMDRAAPHTIPRLSVKNGQWRSGLGEHSQLGSFGWSLDPCPGPYRWSFKEVWVGCGVLRGQRKGLK